MMFRLGIDDKECEGCIYHNGKKCRIPSDKQTPRDAKCFRYIGHGEEVMTGKLAPQTYKEWRE